MIRFPPSAARTVPQLLAILDTPLMVDYESNSLVAAEVHNTAASLAAAGKHGLSGRLKTVTPVRNVPSTTSVRAIEVLHEIGLATTPVFGSTRILATEWWAILRYMWAFDTAAGRLRLSDETQSHFTYHHKTALSEYLGIGFGLTVVKASIQRQIARSTTEVLDVDSVGAFRQVSLNQVRTLRPDYFLITTSPQGTSVSALECKGSSTNRAHQIGQLGKSILQLGSVVDKDGRPPRGFGSSVRATKTGFKLIVVDPDERSEWSAGDINFDDVTEVSESEGVSVVQNVAALKRQLLELEASRNAIWAGDPMTSRRVLPDSLRQRSPDVAEQADLDEVSVDGTPCLGRISLLDVEGGVLEVFRGAERSYLEQLRDAAGIGVARQTVEARSRVRPRIDGEPVTQDGELAPVMQTVSFGTSGSVLRIAFRAGRGGQSRSGNGPSRQSGSGVSNRYSSSVT